LISQIIFQCMVAMQGSPPMPL